MRAIRTRGKAILYKLEPQRLHHPFRRRNIRIIVGIGIRNSPSRGGPLSVRVRMAEEACAGSNSTNVYVGPFL
jgi:hypothetical protein